MNFCPRGAAGHGASVAATFTGPHSSNFLKDIMKTINDLMKPGKAGFHLADSPRRKFFLMWQMLPNDTWTAILYRKVDRRACPAVAKFLFLEPNDTPSIYSVRDYVVRSEAEDIAKPVPPVPENAAVHVLDSPGEQFRMVLDERADGTFNAAVYRREDADHKAPVAKFEFLEHWCERNLTCVVEYVKRLELASAH